MISAWWLLPTFLLGGVSGFFLYDLWGLRVLDRWTAEDAKKRAADERAYRQSQIPMRLRKVWPDLTKEEAENLELLNRLPGKDFEVLIGQMYEKRGYKVELVGGTGDHGIDLVAENEHERVVVQCKRWEILTSIPNSALRDFLGAIQPYSPCRAVFLTTSYLSPKAREFQGLAQMEVCAGHETVRLLMEYGLLPQPGSKRVGDKAQ